jgi:Tol biopolymer transport system component
MPRRPGGLGASDIWVAHRTTVNDPWEEPVNLGSIVNSEHHELAPCISFDGLSLFFNSDRPCGMGVSDIWVATRSSVNDSWRTPVNLGSNINSASWEGEPSLTDDGLTLYFSSLRPEGFGNLDIWMARRASHSDNWPMAVNLGPLVNTSWADVGPEVSADGSMLYFHSNRPGGPGFWDIWQAPAQRSSVDLTQEEILVRWAENLVESEFGKGVISRQN